MAESRMDRVERVLEEFSRVVMEDRKSNAVANAELRASIAELKESQKKTDEQIRENGEQILRIGKKVDDMRITLGNLGVIDGKVAEDLFYRNVRKGTKLQRHKGTKSYPGSMIRSLCLL